MSDPMSLSECIQELVAGGFSELTDSGPHVIVRNMSEVDKAAYEEWAEQQRQQVIDDCWLGVQSESHFDSDEEVDNL